MGKMPKSVIAQFAKAGQKGSSGKSAGPGAKAVAAKGQGKGGAVNDHLTKQHGKSSYKGGY